jgi:replicative DNA helicase
MSRRSSVEHYAGIVRDRAIRRGLMEKAIDYAHACSNGHTTEELLEIGAGLFRASMAVDPEAVARCRSTNDLMAGLSASVKSERGRRLPTFIGALDNRTKGIAPGEVLTIVARPQVGKSALASQIAVRAATAGERVVFYSLEMPREQAVSRMIQQALGITDAEVEKLARADWADLTPRQAANVAPLRERILIVDRGKSSVEHLDSSMLEAEALLQGKPRLAVIDYLGLMCSGAKNLPVYQRVSEAAIDCKSFAKRHQVAVVLLSQAGRDQDQDRTEGAAPLGLDAARDSGVVEESADFMANLWRPWLASKLSPLERHEVKGQLWCRLLKNRRGELGSARLHFDHDSLRISDWPEEA